MNGLTYKFEALPILRGYDVLASGEADVEYTFVKTVSNIGTSHIFIQQINITSIVVYRLKDPARPPLNLSQDHWLYKPILDALNDDADLFEACEIDAEEEF